jgi:small subunit ribosomal protein S1
MRVWERIREAHEKDEGASGTLVKKIKGGVRPDGRGCVPAGSQTARRVPNIDELSGQSFEFKIIKLNKRRRNIVAPRRVLLRRSEDEAHVLMKELSQSGAERHR